MSKPEVALVGSGPDWYIERYMMDFAVHPLNGGDPASLPPEVAQRVRALISIGPVKKNILDGLPNLGLIANAGVGYEKIDVEEATRRGIRITNTPEVTDGCVADMAFALLLAAARQIVNGDRYVRDGSWAVEGEFPLVGRVHGRRMGILGLGHIGKAIAKRAQAFDMEVAYHNRRQVPDSPYSYFDSPRALAEAVDYFVVACPGGEATRHLVDAEVLGALGGKGIIVNISRGTIIDETALVAALQGGLISAAGLDVFEKEPTVPAALRELDNVVLMPHRGGGTIETWEEASDLVKANLHAFFSGKDLLTPIPQDL
ncbi:MAG: 2-hydroxyacid dehydrogenase [Rhodovibrionaceae bacterium]